MPSSDPHLSEYLPERWQGRQWASGFTGSIATLAVTLDRAALFADSRYWVQAERELAGSGIELVKTPSPLATQHVEWLCEQRRPRRHRRGRRRRARPGRRPQLQTELERCGVRLRSDLDVLADAWPERPAAPTAPGLRAHRARGARVARRPAGRVRAAMREAGATHHLLSTVDDIAWMLNLRGADVSYNPVFLAHLLVAPDTATLFIAAAKVDADAGRQPRRRRRPPRPLRAGRRRARRPARRARRCCSTRSA